MGGLKQLDIIYIHIIYVGIFLAKSSPWTSKGAIHTTQTRS